MSDPPRSGFVLARVTVASGADRVLDAVSGHLPARRCTAVVGPSGAGKSTLLRVLNRRVGLVAPVLAVYCDLRVPCNPRRFGQARALAVLASPVVNVVTI